VKRFLWVIKTLPGALLVAMWLEWVATGALSEPVGATTLVWAERK